MNRGSLDVIEYVVIMQALLASAICCVVATYTRKRLWDWSLACYFNLAILGMVIIRSMDLPGWGRTAYYSAVLIFGVVIIGKLFLTAVRFRRGLLASDGGRAELGR